MSVAAVQQGSELQLPPRQEVGFTTMPEGEGGLVGQGFYTDNVALRVETNQALLLAVPIGEVEACYSKETGHG